MLNGAVISSFTAAEFEDLSNRPKRDVREEVQRFMAERGLPGMLALKLA